jgi:hypothetical protein
MADRVYISNISPLWPEARQEALLREAIRDYPKGVNVYDDILTPRERRAHKPPSLVDRDLMLRPNSARRSATIYIASLAVFAWTDADMLKCITAAASKGMTIRVLDVDLTIGPDAGAQVMSKAIEAFAAGRKRQTEFVRGQAGGKASAENREGKARAAAESIKAAWARRDERTPDLLARAGISLNTAKRYLGSRPLAQRARDGADKRQSARKSKP